MRTARRFGALVVPVGAVVGLLAACEANYEVQTTDVELGGPAKRLTADWTIGMIRDQPKAGSFPGGQYYEQVKAEGTSVTLTGT